MKKSTSIVLSYVLMTGMAMATGDSYCRAVDGSDAEFGYGAGRVPGLAIVSASIQANGIRWSTLDGGGAIPIIVAQGAQDGTRTIIDFADPQYNEIIASVRIISAIEGDAHRAVGTLQIPGVGVFALLCE